MTGTNDNGPSFGRITLTDDERSSAVIDVENLIGRYSDEDVLCILMTTTINTIHAVEEKRERTRIEEEYTKQDNELVESTCEASEILGTSLH